MVAYVGISEVWQQQVVVDQIGDAGREPGGVELRELGVADTRCERGELGQILANELSNENSVGLGLGKWLARVRSSLEIAETRVHSMSAFLHPHNKLDDSIC